MLVAVLIPLVAATMAGMVALWPAGAGPKRVDLGEGTLRGTVIAAGPTPCTEEWTGPGPPEECREVRVELTGSDDKGSVVRIVEQGASDVGVGERVILSRTLDPASPEPTYVLVDVDRRLPLVTLTGIFVAVVIALGRRRGALALLGFALSVGIIVRFVLPAIVAGEDPVTVAVVGSAAVMLLALYLAHGVNIRTTVAVLGTLTSLALTAVLALVFVEAARLTGFTSDEAILLDATFGSVDL
ncbi:MAG: YibE/F family protein, partial [Actinomycetota bacterium]